MDFKQNIFKKIIVGFRKRAPWSVAAISMIFTPAAGMLILGRWKTSFYYMGLILLAAIVVTGLSIQGYLQSYKSFIWTANLIFTTLATIGTVHCFILAKQKSQNVVLAARLYARLYCAVLPFLFVMTVSAIFRNYFYEPFISTSSVMSPMINEGDYLWLKKNAYNKSNPEPEDIVVFKRLNLSYVGRIKEITARDGDYLLCFDAAPDRCSNVKKEKILGKIVRVLKTPP
jgi:hypothetical protein